MKKFAIILCTLMASYGVLFSAYSQKLDVINIFELSEQSLNEFMLGHHPEIAVEFSAQTALPLHFFLKGDIIGKNHLE